MRANACRPSRPIWPRQWTTWPWGSRPTCLFPRVDRQKRASAGKRDDPSFRGGGRHGRVLIDHHTWPPKTAPQQRLPLARLLARLLILAVRPPLTAPARRSSSRAPCSNRGPVDFHHRTTLRGPHALLRPRLRRNGVNGGGSGRHSVPRADDCEEVAFRQHLARQLRPLRRVQPAQAAALARDMAPAESWLWRPRIRRLGPFAVQLPIACARSFAGDHLRGGRIARLSLWRHLCDLRVCDCCASTRRR